MLFLVGAVSTWAQVKIQCPGDLNGDGIPDPFLFKPNGTPGNQPNPDYDPNVKCIHLAAGDGFINMADKTLYPPFGYSQYVFGFSDVTGFTADQVMMEGMLKAELPAPTITVKQGQKVYLTLTNVGMMMRPDLFDPHSVHWHGFPNASTIFDGEPMASLSINMGSSLTYFYNVVEPGTFMYHCHVEATEHMQMGMLGNLYVTSAQDELSPGTVLETYTHQAGDRYAYSDGDGSTRYDKDYPFQIISFDPNFHNANLNIQPLGFAAMRDTYPLINGRGYPDTINPSTALGASPENNNNPSQPVPTLITATQGQKVLLRLSSVATVRFYTLTSPSIPMKVVGKDTKLLRSSTGANLYYDTHSITLGGGQTADVILDTQNVPPGTYFIYTSNLEELNNNKDDFGGMMTEVVIQ